ncbi:hypothetical protein F2Q69_00011948 [Brassica cretica]|uniref:Uncharacterized protein n=1 Tax=Brassica cretica TaxID=69181 RepID=A0A8S9R7T1_BRACR|nr:hypothetical protein F2Q69_00011948 [Brassica cretica]
MKRGFLGSSKKDPAGFCTIRKSTREESIDTLQATAIDSVNQKSIDSNTTPSIDITCEKAEKLSRLEEAGTENSTSTSTDGRTSTSTDGRTSTSTDDRNSTSTDGTTSTSTDITTSTSTDITTSTSIDIKTSTSIDVATSSSIDDVDREVTMEDSLELEEWLEDIDQNSEKKLDDDQYTSRGDLKTSKASIGRHQPDEIDQQPPHIIDLHPPDIDRHRQPLIDRHYPPNIDRCPLLDVPPSCIIEMEPIEERMYMSKASHLAVPKHQRPPIWTEEADGLHKRVKMIHDPVKIVVPCAVVEVEFPIPPDRSMQLSHNTGIFDDHILAVASQRGLRCRSEVDNSPGEAASIVTEHVPSIDTNTSPSIDTTTSPSIDTATSPSIDTTPSPSIDTTTSSSLDTGRVSEQREFDVCGNLRDGDTTTRSDKKSTVRSRCFSHPFAKLRALLLAEMIDKGGDIDRHCSKEIDQHCSKEIDRHCSRKRGGKRKKIQGRRLDIPEAIDDNMPLSVDKASRLSIDRHLIVSIDAHHQRSDSTKDTKVDQHVNYSHLLRLFEGTKAGLQH